MDITTLGIDIPKSVLHLHDIDADGAVALQKNNTARSCAKLFCKSEALTNRIGSLSSLALQGAEDCGSWP